MYCVDDESILDANVTVTSNGAGGSVTFSWFYETVTGAEQTVGSPVTVTLATGKTQQSVSLPQGVDFSEYDDFFPDWGVQVTSAPGASANNSPLMVGTSAAGCAVD